MPGTLWDQTRTDMDGDQITYKFYVWPVDEAPDNNKATPLETADGGLADSKMKFALLVGLIGLLLWLILY